MFITSDSVMILFSLAAGNFDPGAAIAAVANDALEIADMASSTRATETVSR